MKLNLYALAWPVTALGPGRRVALWVAGCRKNCPGCISPEIKPVDAGKPLDIDLLRQRLLAVDLPLSGLSISGGEPVDQADGLALLLERLALDRPEWNVILYTGYILAEVIRRAPRLAGWVDVLIDGPYLENSPSSHPLLGSGNQEIHFLTEKGRSMKQAIDTFSPASLDLALGPKGQSMLVGVSSPERRRAVRRGLVGGEEPRGHQPAEIRPPETRLTP